MPGCFLSLLCCIPRWQNKSSLRAELSITPCCLVLLGQTLRLDKHWLMKRRTTHPVYEGRGMAVQRWAVGGAILQIPWGVGVHAPPCLGHPEHQVKWRPLSFPLPVAQLLLLLRLKDISTFVFPQYDLFAPTLHAQVQCFADINLSYCYSCCFREGSDKTAPLLLGDPSWLLHNHRPLLPHVFSEGAASREACKQNRLH